MKYSTQTSTFPAVNVAPPIVKSILPDAVNRIGADQPAAKQALSVRDAFAVAANNDVADDPASVPHASVADPLDVTAVITWNIVPLITAPLGILVVMAGLNVPTVCWSVA